jgi:glyoxylase-like metal-dependent hydrolase (beta-lactamase superfamily II)
VHDVVVSAWQYEHGVFAVDSGLLRQRMAACYILEDEGELALVETGTNHSVARILKTLELRGWQREQVRWVIVTHVHLDHAGGAGKLMRELPAAKLVVHPRGARHLIDPQKLEASARGVYGDKEFEDHYGSLVPVPESRVIIANDGYELALGSRQLEFIDTPGHARHHFCVWDSASSGWFSGDTFGISYKELDTAKGPYIFPTTSPVQFDPEAHHRSIDRLAERNPRYIYPTHFGRISYTSELADKMHAGVDAYVGMAEEAVRHDHPREQFETAMRDWLMEGARAHGCLHSDTDLAAIMDMDVKLNTAGLLHWLKVRNA